MTIQTLIDKQDNFEVIRDQIASILVLEVASQQALATTAGKDPLDWKLDIYTEQSNPIEKFLNGSSDGKPIVNVWFDNSNFEMSASNIIERQKSTSIFNIDCYGYGLSQDDGGTGHVLGDQTAALESQRAMRLSRNILMASEYTYLGMQGVVWRRWPQSMTSFQPQQEDQNVLNVLGSRISLQVEFNEFSPQYVPETLEFLSIDVLRAEDGQIVLEADYDYTI